MSISMNRYVNIVSGVGGGAAVATRALIGRFFSTNNLIPTGTQITFNSAADVGAYFGTGSTEYLRAVFYFGWISKNITTPQSISFARWVNAAVGSMIFGRPGTYAVSSFTSITTGDFTLTMGGFTFHMTAINLSGAANLAAVAALIQTAVRAQSGGGVAWTSATVTFDATRGCFDLVSGTTGADTISITAGVTTDVAGPLGWLTGAILSNGSAIETITFTLTNSTQISNNFGSFAFLPTLTQNQIVEAATWNDGQNEMFIYSVPVTASNASAISAAVLLLSGVALTLAPLSTEYPEQVPMMILAATNYTARNSTQNYMFQIFSLTPSVTTDTDANTYDALRVNYYGQTQSAGQNLAFYQRGYMMGISTDALDQNTYSNEIWLKSSAQVALISLLLSLAKVSANTQGITQINAVLQSVIDAAVFNGTISVGKPLNIDQQLFITNATGDSNAWQQVQTIGYWVGVTVQSYVNNSSTEWKAVYTLIYSKDDVIRKIEGSDILI